MTVTVKSEIGPSRAVEVVFGFSIGSNFFLKDRAREVIV